MHFLPLKNLIELLHNVANKEQFEGETARRNAAYKDVCEVPSTVARHKLLLEASYKRVLLFLSLIFFLNSCTLKPVYSEKHYTNQLNNELNAIDVEPIKSIDGAEFYHRLTSILPQTAKAQYLLKAQFTSVSVPATIEKNSNVLRESLNQLVKYQLIEIKTNKILTSEKFYQTTSYNTIFTTYAADVEREETKITLAQQAAEEIRNRLILYFAKNKNLKTP